MDGTLVELEPWNGVVVPTGENDKSVYRQYVSMCKCVCTVGSLCLVCVGTVRGFESTQWSCSGKSVGATNQA